MNEFNLILALLLPLPFALGIFYFVFKSNQQNIGRSVESRFKKIKPFLLLLLMMIVTLPCWMKLDAKNPISYLPIVGTLIGVLLGQGEIVNVF